MLYKVSISNIVHKSSHVQKWNITSKSGFKYMSKLSKRHIYDTPYVNDTY